MRVVLRTDGNHTVGMGDVWGSIGLADEFAKQQDEVLFIVSGGQAAAAAITDNGYQVTVATSFDNETKVLCDFRPDLVVINKLDSPQEYVRSLKKLARFVATFDDAGQGAQQADLAINAFFAPQHGSADHQYIPLKTEIQELHQHPKAIKDQVGELLVTQGGSDTYGFTPMIIRALEGLTVRPHCTAVIGPEFDHQTALKQAVSDSTLDLTILENPRLTGLIRDADLAITAGGLTMFELACAGIPSLVVGGEHWDEQTAAPLHSAGALKFLGFGRDIDYAQLPGEVDTLAKDAGERKSMSRVAQRLVDGKGSKRTVTLLRERALQATEGGR